MVQVFAVGRIRYRREVVGYKLLNLDDLTLKDYSLERIINLLKSGNTIGNLYYDKESNEIKEYYCSRTLTEFTKSNKRIGKGKDTFLTIFTDSCSAGLSHYHSSEVFYSREGLFEVKDMLDLNYIQHYDVDSLKDCMPFLNDDPVDMYVKNFMVYYNKLNMESESIFYELNKMGMLKLNILTDLDELKIDFCRALESLTIETDKNIKKLVISDSCESVLPNSIVNFKFDEVILGKSSICSKSFRNCEIGFIDLKLIHPNSRDDIFDNCIVKHLKLPKWYDSWDILNYFNGMVDTIEITNTSCTNSIWEIGVKDKLSFKKVKNLILPVDFDYEQENSLRESFTDVNIIRNIE